MKKRTLQRSSLVAIAEEFLTSQNSAGSFWPAATNPTPWFEPGSQDRDRVDWRLICKKGALWDFRPSDADLTEMRQSLPGATPASLPITSKDRDWWKGAAWYQPLHFRNQGDWGIYFSNSRIRSAPKLFARFAKEEKETEKIKEKPQEYFNRFCLAAFFSLFLRETFRHRLECYSIRLHVVTSQPHYSCLGKDLEDQMATAYAYRRLDDDPYRKRIGSDVCILVRRMLKLLAGQPKEKESDPNNRFFVAVDNLREATGTCPEVDFCSSASDFEAGLEKLLPGIQKHGPTIPVVEKGWPLMRDLMMQEFDENDLKQQRLWVVSERVPSSCSPNQSSSQTSATEHPADNVSRDSNNSEAIEGQHKVSDDVRGAEKPSDNDASNEQIFVTGLPIRDPFGPASSAGQIPQEMCDWLQTKQKLLAPGKLLPDWPNVLISEDDPPLFVSNPVLKAWYEEDRDERNGQPECEFVPDHESLLGVYIWKSKQIIIWRKGVDCCSKLLKVSYESLFDCVLIHELGHWFNAEALTPSSIVWDLTCKEWKHNGQSRDESLISPDWRSPAAALPQTIIGDARSVSSRSYHEAWAQLFAWLYGCEKSKSDVLPAFSRLEPLQSRPYQAWRGLLNDHHQFPNASVLEDLDYDQSFILQSLEWSRSLKQPVSFADSKRPDTNMLKWLKDQSFNNTLKSKRVARVFSKL